VEGMKGSGHGFVGCLEISQDEKGEYARERGARSGAVGQKEALGECPWQGRRR